MSTSKVYQRMKELVDSGATYRFEGINEEDSFEPFEGIPVDIGSEMFVRVTKDNGTLKKDDVVSIDTSEFCFMSIKKVS